MRPTEHGGSPEGTGALRLDRWLWFARFFRSRTLASRLCAAGRVRVDGVVVQKAHHEVRPGDVLTFPQGSNIRIVRVVALGHRRGPPAEALGLYEDLEPPVRTPVTAETPVGARASGAGRPTKADRRALDRLKDRG